MNLRDFLPEAHVIAPLAAKTVREAAEQLVARIAAGGAGDAAKLRAAVDRAWPDAVVAVGEVALVAHVRTDAVTRIVAGLGVAPGGIRWEEEPRRDARIIIFVAAPPREAARYLQVMGAFARVLADQAAVGALLAAKRPEDVVALPLLDAIELPPQLTVRDVMTPNVVTITAEKTLGEAARLMFEKDIRALPVVNEAGGFIGMVTHRELLRHLVPGFVQRAKTGEFRAPTKGEIKGGAGSPADPRSMPLKDAMARSVLCLNEDQTLADVASLMQTKDVDRFPVVREGIVVGFLTRADLVRRLIAL
ncbi:MAG TPA: CBS domain-containing protein [Gemmatimonadales bacterium]|nr:CBS domain-containing protein [Gemmatimonadales bacterium]